MNRIQTWIAKAIGMEAEAAFRQRIQDKLDTLEERGGFEVVLEAWRQNRANAESSITPNNSLQVAAVWACVRVLSETVASLPLFIYERQEQGKRRAQDHYLYRLLHDQPNPVMTAFEYRQLLESHLETWGNAYSRLFYDPRGQVEELWPLRPDRIVEVRRDAGRKFFRYQDDNGSLTWYSDDDIWHIPGMGYDGLVGYSPIAMLRRSIGLAVDAEEFGARFFSNDARPGIVLEHPGRLKPEAHKILRDEWENDHKGVAKSHRPAILEEGMKLHEIGIPPEDAQFLETRKFQVREIARIFGVQPHLIADLEQATFSNIEHQSLEFVIYTIRPRIIRIEQSISSNLMLERDRARYFAEHLVDGLLRGDTLSRYQAYAVGRQNGWLNADDIRRLENMDELPNGIGKIYLVPPNMIPADQVGDTGSTEKTPAPTSTARSLPADETREMRARRSATTRHRMALAQRKVMLDVAKRAMRRETHDLGDAVKKYFGKRDSGQFLIWLDGFLQEHADWMTRQYLPIFQAYGEMITAEVQEELGNKDDLQAGLDKFVRSYAGSFAAQQTGISAYRLKEAIQRAANEGVDQEEALASELERWEEKRPAEIAQDQSIRAGNAIAKAMYLQIGVRVLRWVTFGGSCPFCQAMDGRTAQITKTFLPSGSQVNAEGLEPMTTTTDIGHAPLHDGCDCMITAG